MLDVPEFLDFAAAENEATALARQLNTHTRGWEGLLAIAQALMTRFQDLPSQETDLADDLWDYSSASPIVAAARIFDMFAAFDRNQTEDERRDLSLQAAVCYGMYGNFPAATAVVTRAKLVNEPQVQ